MCNLLALRWDCGCSWCGWELCLDAAQDPEEKYDFACPNTTQRPLYKDLSWKETQERAKWDNEIVTYVPCCCSIECCQKTLNELNGDVAQQIVELKLMKQGSAKQSKTANLSILKRDYANALVEHLTDGCLSRQSLGLYRNYNMRQNILDKESVDFTPYWNLESCPRDFDEVQLTRVKELYECYLQTKKTLSTPREQSAFRHYFAVVHILKDFAMRTAPARDHATSRRSSNVVHKWKKKTTSEAESETRTQWNKDPLLDSVVNSQANVLETRSCLMCWQWEEPCDKAKPCKNCKKRHVECVFPVGRKKGEASIADDEDFKKVTYPPPFVSSVSTSNKRQRGSLIEAPTSSTRDPKRLSSGKAPNIGLAGGPGVFGDGGARRSSCFGQDSTGMGPNEDGDDDAEFVWDDQL